MAALNRSTRYVSGKEFDKNHWRGDCSYRDLFHLSCVPIKSPQKTTLIAGYNHNFIRPKESDNPETCFPFHSSELISLS
jgi:hypothetical protein